MPVGYWFLDSNCTITVVETTMGPWCKILGTTGWATCVTFYIPIIFITKRNLYPQFQQCMYGKVRTLSYRQMCQKRVFNPFFMQNVSFRRLVVKIGGRTTNTLRFWNENIFLTESSGDLKGLLVKMKKKVQKQGWWCTLRRQKRWVQKNDTSLMLIMKKLKLFKMWHTMVQMEPAAEKSEGPLWKN